MALQVATATFNGTQDTVAVSWTAPIGNFGITAGVTVTDSIGPVVITLESRTSTGCTVRTSARFTGTVELNIWDKP
jgi:hypothetical protein